MLVSRHTSLLPRPNKAMQAASLGLNARRTLDEHRHSHAQKCTAMHAQPACTGAGSSSMHMKQVPA